MRKINSLSDALIRLVKSNDTLSALQNLEQLFLRNDMQPELQQVSLFLVRLNKLSQDSRMGILENEAINLELNRINKDVYEIINELKYRNLEVHDPFWGLPALPESYLPNKPFRWLKHYTEKETLIFYGRSDEIRDVYFRLVDSYNDPILLFFGQSGVGKSSLLKAGIIPRLEINNIIIYLRSNILERFENELWNGYDSDDCHNFWKDLEFAQGGKPVYIILDQFEELFINNESETQINFLIETFSKVFSDPQNAPKGKLIISYRKEFHAEIEDLCLIFDIPFTTKYIKRLSKRSIVEIINGITNVDKVRNKYQISIPSEDSSLPLLISEELTKDPASPIAPVLQILLTKMWERANLKEKPEVNFTIQLYREIEKEGIGFSDFLKEQINRIRNWNSEVVDSGLVLDLMYQFVTEIGTARNWRVSLIKETYSHNWEIVHILIQHLKRNYLLIEFEIENLKIPVLALVHDSLAPIVRKFYLESKAISQIARKIIDAKANYLGSKSELLLNSEEIENLKNAQKWMKKLSSVEFSLLEKSIKGQDEFHPFLDLIDVGIWNLDIGENNISVDSYTREIFNLGSNQGRFSVETIVEKIHPEDQPIFALSLKRCIETGETVNIDHRISLNDESERYMNLRLKPRLNKEGKPFKVIATHQDITDRINLKLKLKMEKERAENAMIAKAHFLNNMSHEIRTPINGVIGLAEIISTEYGEEEGELNMYADLLLESGQRLLRTIGSILDLSNLESFESEITFSPICINNLLETCCKDLENDVLDKQIDLHLRRMERTFYVESDSSLLQKVMEHLIGNAIKFTKEGAVEIWIEEYRNIDPQEFFVDIIVKDTGIGMSQDFIKKKLFEKFEQESDGLDRNYEGSGLGLSLVKRILEILKGKIFVKSQRGIGTEFTVRFPKYHHNGM